MEKLTWSEVRERAGLTSSEMADRLGISRPLYQMKETYKRVMRVEEALEIARIAGVDLQDVILKNEE